MPRLKDQQNTLINSPDVGALYIYIYLQEYYTIYGI